MKNLIIITSSVFITITSAFAQREKSANGKPLEGKDEIKAIEKEYGMWTSHGKFYKNKEWAMCKFSVVYKLTTSMTAKAMAKSKDDAMKVKTSSGAFAILNGISEADLQKTTDMVAQNFIKRMKDEAGVNVSTWNSYKSSKNTDDLREEQEDKEIYSKSQGLAYAMTYDSTPHYNRVIVFIPGGKKLSKELNKNVMEMCLYIDFADVVATAAANISSVEGISTITYTLSKETDQKMYPGIRLVPNLGSESPGEIGKNLSTTNIKGHDHYGYMFSIGLLNELVSPLEFVDKIEPSDGKLPAVLSNRRNNKLKDVTTFNVFVNPEKFTAAVMDVANQYFDKLIKVYKFRASE